MIRFYKSSPQMLYAALTFIAISQLCLYFIVVAPVQALVTQAEDIFTTVETAKSHVDSEDIDALATDVKVLHDQITGIEDTMDRVDYLQVVPIIRPYYQDADSLVTAARIVTQSGEQVVRDFEPFAPVVGIGVESAEINSASKKLEQLVTIAPNLTPTIEIILEDMREALPYISDLHWDRYPDVGDDSIQDKVYELVTAANGLEENLESIKPLIISFPSILGEPDPKTYLVLFQNDKELRPTGGFITSYAVLTADSGTISISDAKNIYEVSTSEGFLPPPDPIVRYLKVNNWHMRDTNFSPDFKESMETFDYYWNTLGLQSVDGYIAADTQFVAALLGQLGAVEVEGYETDFSLYPGVPEECKVGGTMFTEENVVCRLEFYAQRLTNEQSERKDVIGKLMDEMYQKLMQAPPEQWWPLFQVITKEFGEKHVLITMQDETFQSVVEDLDWGGRIAETSGDYLHVNDANLAGLKSDMYLKRSVKQSYEVAGDGKITKTVTLTYENTGAFDGWLNATARNYVRVYVPKGSQLIDSSGGEVQTSTFEDLGKTVFDNFLLIPPQDSAEVTFTYTIPMQTDNEDLGLLIQKQPGKDVIYHSIEFNNEVLDFELRKDQHVTLQF